MFFNGFPNLTNSSLSAIISATIALFSESTNAGSKAVSYMLSEDALRYATPEFLIKDISRWLSEKLVSELRNDFKC